MATSPDTVRGGLTLISGAVAADTRAVAAAGSTPAEVRALLFTAAPLIVGDYSDGSSALALEWYEELRAEASPRRPYSPTPVTLATEDDVKTIVATSTLLLSSKAAPDESFPEATEKSLTLVIGGLQELVTDAFRDTVTDNSHADPSAVGWRRFARAGACKFCVMLADRGAVYTERTVRFAAHGAVMGGHKRGGNCACLAGPAFGGVEASAMQYVASRRNRSDKQQAALREYLNENYPDAPG